ncbi:MAG: extracellular solute-binding protein [Eubacteriales bacterium]|nr:extracellular solute-binding protein [Eubacteriales bacterium]
MFVKKSAPARDASSGFAACGGRGRRMLPLFSFDFDALLRDGSTDSGARGRRGRRLLSLFAAVLLWTGCVLQLFRVQAEASETVTLRVCNWEEYIDLGDWDEEETIELPSGDILGENSMVEDFEEWYEETYGKKVRVEYSTFGTNEDLYNMLTLGDVYDLVCPSEYLIMKLMAEKQLVPLSDAFFDTSEEYNYYSRGVSPYIRKVFEDKKIGGEPWARYMAGYMWGVTGLVYNPALVTKEQASTWAILADPSFKRQVTIKDSVRDSYFAAVGAIKSELLTSEEFRAAPDYAQKLEDEMNDTSPEMVAQVEEWLKGVKNNVFSFETDAGKADMITGKVAVNYQWSGDGVYTMDQADEDGFELAWAVPEESTDIYFDGWVMLKNGIGDDAEKQHAAEAFINFLSRPDNAIRNMYYIGYTSVLSGGDDPRLFEYAQYNYEAEEEEEDEEEAEEQTAGEGATKEKAETEAVGEDGAEEEAETEAAGEDAAEESADEAAEETVPYDLSYFFSEDGEGEYIIYAPESQVDRQLSAAYPPADVIGRSSIMVYFNEEQSARINQMWINVRCFDIRDVPAWAWVLTLAAAAAAAWMILFRFRHS